MIPAGSILTAGPSPAMPAAAQEEAAAFCDLLCWAGSPEHFLEQLPALTASLPLFGSGRGTEIARSQLEGAGHIFGEQTGSGRSRT